MSGNIDQAHAKALLDASLLTASLPASTGPLKLALITTAGSNTALGTEVTGGSYARQTATMAATSASGPGTPATTSNSAPITFTGMPALANLPAMELHDSTVPTSVRHWLGNLSAAHAVGAGDTVTFDAGAVVVTMS